MSSPARFVSSSVLLGVAALALWPATRIPPAGELSTFGQRLDEARRELRFVEVEAGVYRADRGSAAVWATAEGWRIAIDGPVSGAAPAIAARTGPPVRAPVEGRVVIGFALEAARRCEIVPQQRVGGYTSIFRGSDPDEWRRGLPGWARLRLAGMLDGIEVVLRDGAEGIVEYDVHLEPGARLDAVAVRVAGADGLSLGADGELRIATRLGAIVQPPPVTWEERPDGSRRPLRCEYRLLGADRFGFAVDGWSARHPLVIDPALLHSTFVGGSGRDQPTDLAVGPDGEVTVVGFTYSKDFPARLGYDNTYNGGTADAFVARLDARLSKLAWCTYLGGDGGWGDYAHAVAIGPNREVTVAGAAARRAKTAFPTTDNVYSRANAGRNSAFLSRLSADGKRLVYSTFLGGSGAESILSVHVDGAGRATICGETTSSKFPVVNGFRKTFAGVAEGFVARLDPSKTGSAQLVWSTLFGGSGGERVRRLAVSRSGTVTIAGDTQSSDLALRNAYQTKWRGGGPWNSSGFLARLDPSQTDDDQLLWSTYLNGSATELVWALGVDDRTGQVTVAGATNSSDFPIINGYDATRSSGGTYGFDGFAARLDPARRGSSQLVWSTFLGGKHEDQCVDLDLGPSGEVYLIGYTYSADFPTSANAVDRTYDGGTASFVTVLDPGKRPAAQLVYSTLLDGPRGQQFTKLAQEFGAIARDGATGIVVTGYTGSPGFPTRPGAFDTTHNGERDVYVARLCFAPCRPPTTYGTATPHCNGTTKLIARGCPRIGNLQFAIDVDNAIPSVRGFMAIGPGKGPLSLRCRNDPARAFTVEVQPIVVLFDVPIDGRGKGTFGAPIPFVPALRGARVYFQLAQVSSPHPCSRCRFGTFDIAASRGLEVLIQ